MGNSELFSVMFLGFLGIACIGLIFGLIEVIARWQIYKKMEEPGWASIIPFYSDYIMYKHTWHVNWFWVNILLSVVVAVLTYLTKTESIVLNVVRDIVAVYGVVAYVRLRYGLAKGFGHGIGYTLGLIFFPFIFTLLLGFSHTEVWLEETEGSESVNL